MSRLCARILVGVLSFCGFRGGADAQLLPAFCESVAPAMLSGLEAPYSQHVAPDGTAYCEGLLPGPIAILPPEVISVKQDQSPNVRFTPGTKAVLTWPTSSPTNELTHVRLRALTKNLFALDAAVPATKFEWKSDLIARLQPDWENIAALLTRQIDVMAQKEELVVPVRQGPGCSDSYTVLVRSDSPIHLTTALLEPIGGKRPFLIPISSRPGPAPKTWQTTISFSNRPQGIFRLSLGEDIHRSGAVTKAIYLLVTGCPRRTNAQSER
jgi:hypothetical protein